MNLPEPFTATGCRRAVSEGIAVSGVKQPYRVAIAKMLGEMVRCPLDK